jgi:predicted membrane protein
VELDLTEATFEPGVTTIDVRAFMGYVQIRFPAGVRVESAGRALFGYFAIKGGAPGNAPSVVRITGRAALGFAEVFLP